LTVSGGGVELPHPVVASCDVLQAVLQAIAGAFNIWDVHFVCNTCDIEAHHITNTATLDYVTTDWVELRVMIVTCRHGFGCNCDSLTKQESNDEY